MHPSGEVGRSTMGNLSSPPGDWWRYVANQNKRSAMSARVFTSCPRCGEEMEDGFAGKGAGLSFVARDKFERFAFVDEDVSSWAE